MVSSRGESPLHSSPQQRGLHTLEIILSVRTPTGCMMPPTTYDIPRARFFTRPYTDASSILHSCPTLDNAVHSADEFTQALAAPGHNNYCREALMLPNWSGQLLEA